MYLCFSFDPLFHSLPSSSLPIFLIHSQSRKYIYETPSLIHCFPYLLFFTPLHYLSPSHSFPSPLYPFLCPFLFPHSFFSHLSHTHIHLLLLFSFFFSTVLFFTFRFFSSLFLLLIKFSLLCVIVSVCNVRIYCVMLEKVLPKTEKR